MRWPWSKQRPAVVSGDEAAQAIDDSQRRLHQARRVSTVVDAIADALDQQRQLNDFAARVAAAYRERR